MVIQIQCPSCPSSFPVDPDKIPAKTDEVDGIAWLPRLIVKARAKLAGELPPDLMYGCGGDRPFLRERNSSLIDFLRVTLDAGDDDRTIIDYIKAYATKG